jgi:dihydroorotase
VVHQLPEVVIKGGEVIDASGARRADVLVRDGLVVDVAAELEGDSVLDASGCVVSPGLVDLHVHLREPGDEEAETIETGTRAAARGGFTAVVAMPNTRPALDDAAVVSSVLATGKAAGLCEVVSSGCITVARAGEQLAPMGELYALGVRIFTDDGFCVASAGVMRRALEYAASLPGAVVAQHAEDESLAGGGHMHEGAWSSTSCWSRSTCARIRSAT